MRVFPFAGSGGPRARTSRLTAWDLLGKMKNPNVQAEVCSVTDVAEAVSALVAVGLTPTEAKLYLALLQAHPATGYELANRAGVPRSAVYAALRRLTELGAVTPVSRSPVRYVPRRHEDFLRILRDRSVRLVEEAKRALDRLVNRPEEPETWALQGYEEILAEARRLVSEAVECVHASLWAREARALQPDLVAAVERGAEVVLFSFTALPEELSGASDRLLVYSYRIPEGELEEHWQHKIVLVVDGKRALLGSTEQSPGARAVVTDEPAIVEVASSNIVLDVTLWGNKLRRDTSRAVAALRAKLAPIDELETRYSVEWPDRGR